MEKKLKYELMQMARLMMVEVRDILFELKKYDIHSIEQPIEKGNWKLMKVLCNEDRLFRSHWTKN